jgi:hypothetical protein
MLDPTSRERDMRESVKAATHEALLSQIQKATEAVDITASVEAAANEAARALVGEVVGSAPRRLPASPTAPTLTVHYNAEAEAAPMQPTHSRNGRKAEAENIPKG